MPISVSRPTSSPSTYQRLEVNASLPPPPLNCTNPSEPEPECANPPVPVSAAPAFYTRINGDWDLPSGTQHIQKKPEDRAPVLEMMGSLYVVSQVAGDAPAGNALFPGNVNTSATSSISYSYKQAQLQAAGRGFLGFQQLTTVDNQTGIATTTRYRQDWPFTGMPMATAVVSAAGHLLSASSTGYAMKEWTGSTEADVLGNGTAAIGPIHVLPVESVDQSYDLVADGDSQGALLKTVVTGTGYDDEGNPLTIDVTTTNESTSQVEQIVETTHAYQTTSFDEWEARLKDTTVTTTRPNLGGSVMRRSTFEYYTSGKYRGMLRKEIVEPYKPEFRLESFHYYDTYGNREQTAVTGGTETRCDVDTVVYDSRGRYVDATYDCLGRLTQTVEARNIFGEPTHTLTYLDATTLSATVETRVAYGTLGREYYRWNETGASSTTYFSDTPANCPAGTAYAVTTSHAGGASSEVCYDVLARETRTLTLGFDGQWDVQDTEFDESGRVLYKSEPYDLGSSSHWTRLSYDVLGRVVYTSLPDSSWGSTDYAGFEVTTTNALSQARIELYNALGEVVAVTDNLGSTTQFAFDHLGNLSEVTDDDSNVTVTVFNLLGQKTAMTDPDKGGWASQSWLYEYNHFGELVEQIDAKGQTVEMTYDGLGRMATREDTDSSTTWTYDTSPNGLGQLDHVQDSDSGYMKSVLYDSLGRVDEVITNFDGGLYYEKSTFDEYGRPFQLFDAAGDGSYTDHGTVNQYNAYGYLESIGDAVLENGEPRTIYRQVLAMTARGQTQQEQLGIQPGEDPAVTTTYTIDPETGRTTDIDSVNDAGQDVQDLRYQWDDLGNLVYRHEYSGSKTLEESFQYDGLNRLTQQAVAGETPINVTYFDNGNIKTKTGISGTYGYGSSAGPHAATSVNGSTYVFDANGNNTGGGGRSINYTAFDKPAMITKGSDSSSFAYGTDRSRFRRVDVDSSGTTTTRYIGNVEIIFRPNGTQERKRYIAGIAVETRTYSGGSETGSETAYTLKDHLGSLDVITDDAGTIVQELSFGAWGQRRNATTWIELNGSNQIIDLGPMFDTGISTRGFTGHEMLDNVGIIHMNGRIFDAFIGRFLQADPIVQDPLNTQSLNRFSYAFNNPLNAIDPSGFSSWTDFRDGFLKPIAAIAVSVFLPQVLPSLGPTFGVAATSTALAKPSIFAFATAGFVSGGIASGTLKGAAIGAFGGLAFGGIGSMGNLTTEAAILAHGVAGGVMAELQGGKFGHGFLSAGLTKGVTPIVDKIRDAFLGTITSAVIGGTVSVAVGGKFANGAMSGAFSYAFSQTIVQRNRQSLLDQLTPEQRDIIEFLENERVFRSADERYLYQKVADDCTSGVCTIFEPKGYAGWAADQGSHGDFGYQQRLPSLTRSGEFHLSYEDLGYGLNVYVHYDAISPMTGSMNAIAHGILEVIPTLNPPQTRIVSDDNADYSR